jgi:exonuclease VII small subunit
MDDLKERLRKVEGSVKYGADPGGTVTCWHRNPDGPEASARIEALEQRVSELEEALPVFERVIRLAHTLSCDVPITAEARRHMTRAYEALAALNREPNP